MDIVLSDVVVRIPPDQRLLFRIKNLHIKSGSRALIHGASGMGKTTLLHLIAGLFLPNEGTVHVGDNNLRLLGDHERSTLRRRKLGIIFQRLNLIDHLNALENVMLPLESSNAARAEAICALQKVGMDGFLDELVGKLSLGEQQRIAVARVLASRPALILADEPTSSLDDKNAAAVLDALQEAAQANTLLVVSHDQRIQRHFETVIPFRDLLSA